MASELNNSNPAEQSGKIYRKYLLGAMLVVFPIFLFGAIVIIRGNPDAWWAPLIAFIPLFPVLFGLGIFFRFFEQVNDSSPVEQTEKTYRKHLLGAMLVMYPLFLFGAIAIINGSPGAWWLPLIALFPMLPILFGLGIFLHFFDQLDELQRKIQLTSLAIAAGGTGFTTLTYGFLDSLADFPKISWIWVWSILCAFWLIGGFIAKRKYA